MVVRANQAVTESSLFYSKPKISAAFVIKLLHVILKSKIMKLSIRRKSHLSAKFAIADLDENMTKTDMFRKVSRSYIAYRDIALGIRERCEK